MNRKCSRQGAGGLTLSVAQAVAIASLSARRDGLGREPNPSYRKPDGVYVAPNHDAAHRTERRGDQVCDQDRARDGELQHPSNTKPQSSPFRGPGFVRGRLSLGTRGQNGARQVFRRQPDLVLNSPVAIQRVMAGRIGLPIADVAVDDQTVGQGAVHVLGLLDTAVDDQGEAVDRPGGGDRAIRPVPAPWPSCSGRQPAIDLFKSGA